MGSKAVKVRVLGVAPNANQERGWADVKVRDVLIASLGDSFASGEGNPDVKTAWPTEPYSGFWARQGDWHNRWMGRRTGVRDVKPPVWWDSRCHRSFYSQHVVAALKYAADHPSEATTFVSYACSGAAIFDGILAVQSKPPGYADDNTVSKLRIAQIEALDRDLCPPGVGQTPAASKRYHVNQIQLNGAVKPIRITPSVAYSCDTVNRRQVDMILLVIGGNDAGFAKVIFDAMLPREVPKGGVVSTYILKTLRDGLATLPETAQATVYRTLPGSYDVLRDRLLALHVPMIVQSSYPDPMQSARVVEGQYELCGGKKDWSAEVNEHPLPDDHQGSLDYQNLVVLDGAWPDRFVKKSKRWPMYIDQHEALVAQSTMIGPLNHAILKREDVFTNWRVATFGSAFDGHGWCARDESQAPLNDSWRTLPNYEPVNVRDNSVGKTMPDWNGPWAWNPASPTTWDPYASRTRLFRTPNDAALTVMSRRPRTPLGPLAPLTTHVVDVQGRGALFGSMSSAFHPTFEAHVIMGLAVYEKMVDGQRRNN